MEGPPGLGEPMDQQDRRPVGAGRDVVQLGPVDADTLVVKSSGRSAARWCSWQVLVVGQPGCLKPSKSTTRLSILVLALRSRHGSIPGSKARAPAARRLPLDDGRVDRRTRRPRAPRRAARPQFALQVSTPEPTASALGRRLSVSKQAAAKTIAALQRLGYVESNPTRPTDAASRIQVTARGHDMVTIGSALFDEVRSAGRRRSALGNSARSKRIWNIVTPRVLGAEDLARV